MGFSKAEPDAAYFNQAAKYQTPQPTDWKEPCVDCHHSRGLHYVSFDRINKGCSYKTAGYCMCQGFAKRL